MPLPSNRGPVRSAGPQPPAPAGSSVDVASLVKRMSPEQMKSFLAQSVTPGQGNMGLPQGVPMQGSGFVRKPNGQRMGGMDARAIEAHMRQRRAVAKLSMQMPAGQTVAAPPAPSTADTPASQAVAAPPVQAAPIAGSTTPQGTFADPQSTWFSAMGVTPEGWLNIERSACMAWLARNGVTAADTSGHAAWLDSYASAKTGKARIVPAGQAVLAPQPQSLGTTLGWAAAITLAVGGAAYAYEVFGKKKRSR